jgi:hypothetical protein
VELIADFIPETGSGTKFQTELPAKEEASVNIGLYD